MPTAREIAAELRHIARLLPHPLEKKFTGGETYPEIEITHQTEAIWTYAKASRDAVCKVIKPAQPAEYDCEPLLSEAEENSLVGQ